ncbi:MAG: hydroxymethylglutaryl-CoA synthase [bacterium]
MQNNTTTGIIGFGSYIPSNRIAASTISLTNPHSPPPGVVSKSAPDPDEDAVTMGIEAAHVALSKGNISPSAIQSVFVGSESHPYAVKPSATIIAHALGIGPWYMAADTQFACKAGTAALQFTLGLVKSGMIATGMAIGSDTAQAAPGDVLEYTAGAGAAAIILGSDPHKIIATIDQTLSFSSDTPDFWRRPGEEHPQHAGRFTAGPSYFHHVVSCGKRLLEISELQPQDFTYLVLHQPNLKFPQKAAAMLGFTPGQLEASLLVREIGNCYAASSMLALCSALGKAKPGEKVFMVSFGSGAGSDGFILTKM